jgi:hypothetical protein
LVPSGGTISFAKAAQQLESHFRERIRLASFGGVEKASRKIVQSKQLLQRISLFLARAAGTVPLFRDLRRWRIRKRQSPS